MLIAFVGQCTESVSVCLSVCLSPNLVCLLGRGAVFLCILVGFEQQVDEAGDGPGIPQWALVLRTQRQVTDQTNHSLRGRERPQEVGVSG